MAKNAQITLEQISAVKKRLQKLPVKNAGKNREQAMELLAKDFQKAIKKGYTLKDIQGFLAEEGLTVPAYLLKKQTANEWKIPTRKTVAANAEFSGQQAYEKSALLEQKIEAKPFKTATENLAKFVEENEAKPAHAITVKPDTPDTEL
jgi:hypothetical protein